jgi:ElaB/YqjD/DUF883 family membrane-anchored ribosome-binding protein
MGKDARELREEIDETRGRMGETVDAIAYKADVPSRVGDAISDRVDAVKSTITGTVGNLRDRALDMAPDVDASDMQQGAQGAMRSAKESARGAMSSARGAVDSIRENPLGLFFGAAAIGFMIGTMLPGTRLEEERLGPIGDQLKEQAKERVQETVGTARSMATQVVTQAMASPQSSPPPANPST